MWGQHSRGRENGTRNVETNKTSTSGPPHRHTLVAHACTHTHVNIHTHAINVAKNKGQSSILKVGRSGNITSVNQLHQHGMNCILSLRDDTLRRTSAILWRFYFVLLIPDVDGVLMNFWALVSWRNEHHSLPYHQICRWNID